MKRVVWASPVRYFALSIFLGVGYHVGYVPLMSFASLTPLAGSSTDQLGPSFWRVMDTGVEESPDVSGPEDTVRRTRLMSMGTSSPVTISSTFSPFTSVSRTRPTQITWL